MIASIFFLISAASGTLLDLSSSHLVLHKGVLKAAPEGFLDAAHLDSPSGILQALEVSKSLQLTYGGLFLADEVEGLVLFDPASGNIYLEKEEGEGEAPGPASPVGAQRTVSEQNVESLQERVSSPELEADERGDQGDGTMSGSEREESWKSEKDVEDGEEEVPSTFVEGPKKPKEVVKRLPRGFNILLEDESESSAEELSAEDPSRGLQVPDGHSAHSKSEKVMPAAPASFKKSKKQRQKMDEKEFAKQPETKPASVPPSSPPEAESELSAPTDFQISEPSNPGPLLPPSLPELSSERELGTVTEQLSPVSAFSFQSFEERPRSPDQPSLFQERDPLLELSPRSFFSIEDEVEAEHEAPELDETHRDADENLEQVNASNPSAHHEHPIIKEFWTAYRILFPLDIGVTSLRTVTDLQLQLEIVGELRIPALHPLRLGQFINFQKVLRASLTIPEMHALHRDIRKEVKKNDPDAVKLMDSLASQVLLSRGSAFLMNPLLERSAKDSTLIFPFSFTAGVRTKGVKSAGYVVDKSILYTHWEEKVSAFYLHNQLDSPHLSSVGFLVKSDIPDEKLEALLRNIQGRLALASKVITEEQEMNGVRALKETEARHEKFSMDYSQDNEGCGFYWPLLSFINPQESSREVARGLKDIAKQAEGGAVWLLAQVQPSREMHLEKVPKKVVAELRVKAVEDATGLRKEGDYFTAWY